MAGFATITAYVPKQATMLSLGLVAEMFNNRVHLGVPRFDVVLCTDRPGPVTTDIGLSFTVDHGLEELDKGDLVLLLPGNTFRSPPSAAAVDAVRAAHESGAIIATHCVGSYHLAATGLLDGAQATTHWRFAADFAARFPAVTLRPEALYIDEGQVITGAGAAASIDLYLHLLRREHGVFVANTIARDMVVPPHRDGGQAQYIETPVLADNDDKRLTAVLDWAASNLHRPIPVDELAARALMSPRTFARRFKAATGATPHAWLLHRRLTRAEELLERTTLSIEEVAQRVGYASATVLRERFLKRRGVSPRAYRQVFGGPSANEDNVGTQY
ncbi:GlxA family transcriptional regulator [Amycolatopsis plumensis]|uniref:GlxA family transcriptional regulator n=1 Tax=Amycolatopsis plumensis TaxID=236508 RepID=A0ABV5UIT3_9PSEU